jgi:hypothetical protein
MLSIYVVSSEQQQPARKRSRPMKLIDPSTGLMECEFCGSIHLASIRPQSNGRFYRGAWQCNEPNCPSKLQDGE